MGNYLNNSIYLFTFKVFSIFFCKNIIPIIIKNTYLEGTIFILKIKNKINRKIIKFKKIATKIF